MPADSKFWVPSETLSSTVSTQLNDGKRHCMREPMLAHALFSHSSGSFRAYPSSAEEWLNLSHCLLVIGS